MFGYCGREILPAVNVGYDLVGLCFSMSKLKVFIDPFNKVVLKRALDNLVKKVWGHKLVYICTREAVCKGLWHIE